MVSVGQIVSKTVGVAGLGLAMYDAVQCSKMSSRKNAHARQADYLEKSFYNSRTIDNISANSNRLRAKTFDLETWNPLPAFFGKISGGVKGFLYSLSTSLPLVLSSCLAIGCKGFLSKLGAVGVALSLAYNIARNGFGFGKEHPMS